MNTFKFKTNINCNGCKASVTPFMNKLVGENNWTVDLENPDKLLSINSDEVSVQDIINTVKKAGYSADTQK